MKSEKVYGNKKYSHINELLNKKINEKEILIAVHRGTSRGNIVENTIPAYVAALKSGGDMIEIDVIKSTDGVYYAFHDGNEKRLLNKRKNIKEMSSKEIERCSYFNAIGEKISYKVEKLSNILEYFQGTDVLINIDRAWNYFEDLLKFFDNYNVQKQLVIKSGVKEEFLNIFEKHKTKYMYMPIVKKDEEINFVKTYKNINLVGFEVIATDKKSIFTEEKYLKKLKDEGYFIWINSIKLKDTTNLYAGYDDSLSILENEEKGWGVIIKKGANIIQTDWPWVLGGFIKEIVKK